MRKLALVHIAQPAGDCYKPGEMSNHLNSLGYIPLLCVQLFACEQPTIEEPIPAGPANPAKSTKLASTEDPDVWGGLSANERLLAALNVGAAQWEIELRLHGASNTPPCPEIAGPTVLEYLDHDPRAYLQEQQEHRRSKKELPDSCIQNAWSPNKKPSKECLQFIREDGLQMLAEMCAQEGLYKSEERLRKCYQNSIDEGLLAEPLLRFDLVIGASGEIKDARVTKEPTGNPETSGLQETKISHLLGCLETTVLHQMFVAPAEQQQIDVSLPVRFYRR